MVDLFTVFGVEASGTVRHHSFALFVPNGGAQVGLRVLTVKAGLLAALRSIARDDNVSYLDSSDSFSYAFDDASGLMAEDAGPVAAFAAASV